MPSCLEWIDALSGVGGLVTLDRDLITGRFLVAPCMVGQLARTQLRLTRKIAATKRGDSPNCRSQCCKLLNAPVPLISPPKHQPSITFDCCIFRQRKMRIAKEPDKYIRGRSTERHLPQGETELGSL